jgi:deferrochelatase/peroxidase EfeB
VRPVDQADLQGNILCGYGRKYAHGLFLFFRIEDHSAFGRWLGARIGTVTTAVPWEREPPSTLNVALTSTGLREMGLPSELLDTFPKDFRDGMEARSPGLGDTGESDPGRWDDGLKSLHGVLTVLAQERSVRAERRKELEADAQEAGLEVACAQETDVRPDEREPFGFVDGISQPQIDDPDAGPHQRPGDVHVKPGEFVLGYLDEGGVVSAAPAQVGVNGSYMVVRKLEQDPDAFWDFVREESVAQGVRPEWLAAKVFGRWPDGTPLVQSPNASGGSPVDRDRLNDFGYAGDPDGFRCPIGAHIRRTNPRDSLDPESRTGTGSYGGACPTGRTRGSPG